MSRALIRPLLRLRPISVVRAPLLLRPSTFTHPAAPTQRPYSNWREEVQAKWKSQNDIDEARNWVESFTEEDIPKKYCQITFAQSSGPGGQNINKASTKATLHLPLRHLEPHAPAIVLQKIRENSRHLTKDDQILIQSDESRSQHENIDRCYRRLYNILTAAVKEDLPGETSPEKHARVKELQRLEREARMKRKNERKAKKEGRRGNYNGDLDA